MRLLRRICVTLIFVSDALFQQLLKIHLMRVVIDWLTGLFLRLGIFRDEFAVVSVCLKSTLSWFGMDCSLSGWGVVLEGMKALIIRLTP